MADSPIISNADVEICTSLLGGECECSNCCKEETWTRDPYVPDVYCKMCASYVDVKCSDPFTCSAI
jgi:hypothetical protein